MKEQILLTLLALLLIKLVQAQDFSGLDGSKLKGDARTVLGSSGIGPSFRSKRDNAEGDDHAPAAEDSLVSGVEAEEDIKASESTSEDDEEDYEETNNGPTEKQVSGLINGEKNVELEKLMSESSDLAKELHLVFNVLAKRESQLVNEMESLKKALTTAVSVLKESGKISLGQRRRREFVNVEDHPYKACIYIESEDHEHSPLQHQEEVETDPKYPPEPIVKEFIPDDYYYEDDITTYDEGHQTDSEQIQDSQSATSHSSSENDIDLSKVFWLRLPTKMNDETVHQKVNTVFDEVSGEGKDALIIPVPRGLTTSHQLSQGFLKAVVGSNGSKRKRNLRSLRMNVREIKL